MQMMLSEEWMEVLSVGIASVLRCHQEKFDQSHGCDVVLQSPGETSTRVTNASSVVKGVTMPMTVVDHGEVVAAAVAADAEDRTRGLGPGHLTGGAATLGAAVGAGLAAQQENSVIRQILFEY